MLLLWISIAGQIIYVLTVILLCLCSSVVYTPKLLYCLEHVILYLLPSLFTSTCLRTSKEYVCNLNEWLLPHVTNYSKKRFRHMTLVLPVILPIARVVKYCWWKKSCTTWNVFETLSNNGINYQPQLVNAGFLPSRVWRTILRWYITPAPTDVLPWSHLLRVCVRWCPLWVPSWACTESGSSGRGRCWVEASGGSSGGPWKGRKVYSTSSNYDYKTEWSRYHVCDLQFRYW